MYRPFHKKKCLIKISNLTWGIITWRKGDFISSERAVLTVMPLMKIYENIFAHLINLFGFG